MAAFKALIKRAYVYCTDVRDQIKEIDRIKKVAKQLGYKANIIEGLLKSYKQHRHRGFNREDRISKFTYDRKMEGVIEELCRYKGTKMIYKRAPSIYRLLRNDKDAMRMQDKAGVYKIPFENEQLAVTKEYIGVTRRNLATRIKEHKYDVKKGHNNTILAIMGQEEGANVKWDEARIVKAVHSPTIALGMEKVEIYKSKVENKCLNAKDANNLPTAWKYVIEKEMGFKNP
ncbi:uncharacterized protein [Centruroides vittatus]|uniref:uncharacterized protein n=1 Tax=Centruroides vittatus TaxID=120091 RepID=UPI00350E989C